MKADVIPLRTSGDVAVCAAPPGIEGAITRMSTRTRLSLAALSLVAAISSATGCIAGNAKDDDENAPADRMEKFSSDIATLLKFSFDGELTTNSTANVTSQIRAQVLYTVGTI